MARKLTLAIVTAGILVALGVPAAQATTTQPQSIPSGTEVIPYIFHDTESEIGWASSIKLYDPATRKSETVSGPDGTDSYLWQPQLSEDGTKALYLDYHDYAPDVEGIEGRQESIGFISSNGGERTRIVTGEEISEYDLSRDGSKVLYQTYSFDSPGVHLFTAPVESNATPTEVPVPSGFSQVFDPIFDKDGTGIFFTGADSSDTSLTYYQVYHMNLDGTGLTKLTDFTSVHNNETGWAATQPAGSFPLGKELSPDGDTIVYYGYSSTDGTHTDTGIYTLSTSGGTPKEVAVPKSSRGSFMVPHYNHDGSRIMYYQGIKLWSVRSADGRDKQLLAREGLEDSGNWEIVTYAGM